MPIPPDHYLQSRFRDEAAEVHNFKVTPDRSVLVFDATFPAHKGRIRDIPVLFAMMCVSGGGFMSQTTEKQVFEGVMDPGCIGIAPPSAPGHGTWPEMRIIGFGIHVDALKDSFGRTWPSDLDKDVLSKPVRDPMIEATMMQVGYTHAEKCSDSVMLHAAHMVVHHLLDQPAEEEPADKAAAHPLPCDTLDAIMHYVAARIDETVSVEDLAKHVGISRYHFSRRFRAATGQTPYQFVLDQKLDHAAETLTANRQTKVIDAANMVGFRNPARFAEAFRRRFGQSPRLWRLRGR